MPDDTPSEALQSLQAKFLQPTVEVPTHEQMIRDLYIKFSDPDCPGYVASRYAHTLLQYLKDLRERDAPAAEKVVEEEIGDDGLQDLLKSVS